MSLTYPLLFQDFRLGPLTLSNRITMAPTFLAYANDDGTAGEMIIEHYKEVGASGAAMIVVENTLVDYATIGGMRFLRSDEDRFIPELAKLATAIKAGGALAACQINHQGRYAFVETPLAPSVFESPFCKNSRAMTEKDIQVIIQKYAEAAVRVIKAGFDLVELHGGRGYLLVQFLSPYTNWRTDIYGGSLENRMRFPLEVVRAVKEAVGDFPVGYRLTADEWIPGGFAAEEAAIFASELEKAGVTYLSIMTGSNEAPVLNQDFQKLSAQDCYAASVSEQIKKAVNIPVIVAGRIVTPTLAEGLLQKGQTDLIGLARVLLSDPLWPRKALEGREEEIITCRNCYACYAYLTKGQPVICANWEKEKKRSRKLAGTIED